MPDLFTIDSLPSGAVPPDQVIDTRGAHLGAALVLDGRAVLQPARTNLAFLPWLAAIAIALLVGQGLASVHPEPPPQEVSPAPAAAPLVSLRQLPMPAQALVSQTLGEGDAAYHVHG